MSRKFYFSFLVAAAVFMAGHLVVFAQTAPSGGTVEVKKADGTQEPVAGALIEVYRTDIKAGFPSAKSDSKGIFRFAGMPLGGVFTFAVSAPNCAPMIFPNVRAGQEKLLIVLSPGDGRKFSESEARTAKPANFSGELTEEEKKAKADFDKKSAEIQEKNAKAENTNAIITAVAKDAKAAFEAKDYDLAIRKYEEGIAADPNFVGSAPVFNNNRSTALRLRGLDSRNRAIKLTDVTEKLAGLEKARKDFAESATGFLRAWTILSTAVQTEIPDRANYDEAKLMTLTGAQETFRLAMLTDQVDPSIIEAAQTLTPAYTAVETDITKKVGASILYADLYRVAGDKETAIVAYKKVLEIAPDNVDALAGVGLVLVDMGWLKESDKALSQALSQEGANYLQRFVSLAPDTHKLKEGAVGYLEILKAQSIIPVKQPTGKKKP